EKPKKKKDKAIPKKPKKVSKHKLKGHSHSPLAAYCYFPDKVDFETRERKEKIVLLLRRHPITNVAWILIAILMIFAPLTLSFFPILSFLPSNFQFIAVLVWYLITTAFVLESFLTWFFNVNIITDERIVDIDFHNLIYKEVSDCKIDNIQDVTYKMGGVVRTIFNYGDIYIQTAAEVPAFEFLAVPKPSKVARVLQDLIIEEEKEKLEGRVR
ncbi:PH domain-containing protein, partial [Candidatus Woesebacteria bacterium]|nr:PH domain-containing protein [Candidatus Woesebacteria bacterium]